jgi:hypothetical protein
MVTSKPLTCVKKVLAQHFAHTLVTSKRLIRVKRTWLDAELISLSEYELRNFIVFFIQEQ